MLDNQLKIIKKFQDKYPESHVGGSIGLFLHGVDLKRDLRKSDIDLTSKYTIVDERIFDDQYDESSDVEDFEMRYRVYQGESANYTKVEISVNTVKSYEIKTLDGIDYRVSLKEDILYWKKRYANKGVKKHIDDMAVIELGYRPEELPVVSGQQEDVDDLPF